MTQNPGITGVPMTYRPTPNEIDDLVIRATDHPMGTDFLVNGALDAVAATFGVHAFVVEAARQTLPDGGSTKAPDRPVTPHALRP